MHPGLERSYDMCGIAGFCDYGRGLENPEESARLAEEMGLRLKHRGPDAFETFSDPYAAFAHARLAVIDIEGGRQPMSRKSPDGCEYTITYNGELYNTKELRDALSDEGYAFTTHSDTEVLLYAYIHYGEDCPKHLNGISKP
jgi:asparagine synthase (glutamine-hydrolysing)